MDEDDSLGSDDEEDAVIQTTTRAVPAADHRESAAIKTNFVRFSMYCSAVPACALACLPLATARLGSEVGAWQSGILYATYTGASVLGLASWVVQSYGSKRGVLMGQLLFGGGYVVCFWLATAAVSLHRNGVARTLAWVGAALGGVGAAILWTAQGVYFAQAAERHALQSSSFLPDESTRLFSGIFAFTLLVEETVLNVLSTLLVRILHVPWGAVFALYSMIALLATWATRSVHSYPPQVQQQQHQHQYQRQQQRQQHRTNQTTTIIRLRRRGVACCSYRATATVDLLIRDSKLKYLMGFNAAFGFAGAYLNSFISGQVVPILFQDASYVGLLVALHGGSAALASVVFSRCRRKGLVLIVGSLLFLGTAMPFLFQPDVTNHWTWTHLVYIYLLEGIGRASFEGNLKSIFADWFPRDREVAFANITLQNGLASSLAYVLTTRMPCNNASSRYCFTYRDGSDHNVGMFAAIVVGSSLASMIGYWRASYLVQREAHWQEEDIPLNESAVCPSYESVEMTNAVVDEENNVIAKPLQEMS